MSSDTLNTTGAFSQAKDLKNRILFTIIILSIYRLGTYVPLSGIDPMALKEIMSSSQKGLLGMFNVFAGGAVSRMAIFALGIMPYISSSIIVQLLTGVSDYFKNLKEQGEIGRKKITQITRYGTVLIAMLQGYGVSVGLENAGNLVIEPGLSFRLITTISLVAGTTFLMWLGEQITLRGVGNGISLIIFSCSNQSHQENLNNELVEKNNPDQYSESVDSTDSIIHYVRAHRSLEVKNLSFAEARFKKVVELEPNFARGWLGLGEVSILKNNFENASSHLDRALELKPDLYEAIYLKGVAKNFQNNCEEFISLFKEITITPLNRLNLLISNCFLKINDYDQAKLFFDNSDTSFTDDYDLVAEHYFLKGDFNNAKKLINSNQLNYKDPRYLLVSSKISIKEGNYVDAEKKILELIEISKEPKIPIYINQGQDLLEEIKSFLTD